MIQQTWILFSLSDGQHGLRCNMVVSHTHALQSEWLLIMPWDLYISSVLHLLWACKCAIVLRKSIQTGCRTSRTAVSTGQEEELATSLWRCCLRERNRVRRLWTVVAVALGLIIYWSYKNFYHARNKSVRNFCIDKMWREWWFCFLLHRVHASFLRIRYDSENVRVWRFQGRFYLFIFSV